MNIATGAKIKMGTHLIGFPGFGIGPFEINSQAFSILGRDITWYGIIITLAIICGISYSFWRAVKYNGILLDDMFDIAIFSVPSAIIGARVYYVIFNLDMYNTFYSLIATWEGGLAVYGGVIFGFLAGFFVCRHKKIVFMKVFDPVAPAIMLGQIIGRWGNFTNAEAYGGATNLPWRMSIQNIYSSRAIEVHPTFLYEMLWNLAGFVIINLIYKKRKFDGQIFFMYITWYGFGRMLIEELRADSLYAGELRISQVVGFLCVFVGLVLLIINFRKAAAKNLENEVYESVYNLSALSDSANSETPEDKSTIKNEEDKIR